MIPVIVLCKIPFHFEFSYTMVALNTFAILVINDSVTGYIDSEFVYGYFSTFLFLSFTLL